MKMIAAVDQMLGIGWRGKLLVSIPFDQKLFRQETLGKVVVMGRKTMESLPGGRPLEQRVNVVLTTNPDYVCRGVQVVHSMKEALQLLQRYSSDQIYIIGGESLYQQFLPLVDTLQLTEICYSYEADAHFPDFRKIGEWELAAESEEQTYFDLEYYFRRYERRR